MDEELEKVLTFTESAMRRFFGMVRDLQKDFEKEAN
jgi:SPX domain protein involved in polyphosphate accumulation